MSGPTPPRLPSFDPRTALVVEEIEGTPAEDVAALVARCRTAQAAWSALPLAARMAGVRKLRAAFLARGEELAAVLGSEIGKPSGEAWTSEIVTAGELFDSWLDRIEDELEAVPVDLNPINYPFKDVAVVLDPVGVVGLIMPWNYPVHLPLRTIVPAVLAGNGVVFKPSERALRCGRLLAEIFAASLPDGLVVTVLGGPDVGAAVVRGGVDKVVFTGSVAGGRKVAAAAAELLVPCALELGSKDAAIVLHDAQIERTVEGILWGAFHNAGQDCASVERVLVDAKIEAAFVARLVARAKELRVGDDVGPLIDARALEKVHQQVTDAVGAGATLHCGGAPTGTGWFYPASVLTGVPTDAALWREETFGPVVAVRSFNTEDEAVRLANDSPYGLCASVWTGDTIRGRAMLDRLRVGVGYVNNCCFTGPMGAAAWGGRGESGYGVTGSRFGLAGLVHPRTVCVDRSPQKKEMWWYPYTGNLTTMARGLVEVGRPGGARLRGVRDAVTGLIGRWS